MEENTDLSSISVEINNRSDETIELMVRKLHQGLTIHTRASNQF
jgi:hypothetical protein